ncbi:MAG: hypothetical protein K2L41_01290, partial [Muribaculaceae bacterium]|nr:hypothetical protein [Muribaculaceae bacterium]
TTVTATPAPAGSAITATPPTATPSLDELKKQLVKKYNANSWSGCKKIIGQNKELETYKADLEYIIRIRQNKAFDSKGFKTPKLDNDQIDLLKAANYINNDNKPTDAFNITSVDEIADKKNTLESLLKAF